MSAPWDVGHCYLIAELGACHQGSPEIAHRMVDMAAEAGVDAVKTQRRCLEPGWVFSQEELDAPYAGPQSFGATYGEHRAALELSLDTHEALADHARCRGLDFGCSAWDERSADELASIGVDWIKIPSAAATCLPLLQHVAALELPVILSTGGCTSGEVIAATTALEGAPHVAVLQCTSAYPCPYNAIDLGVMARTTTRILDACERILPDALFGLLLRVLRDSPDAEGDVWNGPWDGVSGHWTGIAVDAAAVALGARIIERHVTLDRTWKGTDHAAALEPGGVAKWVRDVRHVEAALGANVKRRHACEELPMRKLRTARLRRVS